MSESERTPSAMFEQLRGEQLSAVTFAQDYLQLWFDGPGINVTNPLTVQSGEASVTSWQPGFRDALCAQIAKTVAAVEIRDGEAFIIRFEDGSQFSVSLREQDYTSPEAIYAHGFRDDARFVVQQVVAADAGDGPQCSSIAIHPARLHSALVAYGLANPNRSLGGVGAERRAFRCVVTTPQLVPNTFQGVRGQAASVQLPCGFCCNLGQA